MQASFINCNICGLRLVAENTPDNIVNGFGLTVFYTASDRSFSIEMSDAHVHLCFGCVRGLKKLLGCDLKLNAEQVNAA